MTRAVVFLAVSLAAASLGLFAQDNTRHMTSAPAAAVVAHNSDTSGAQQDTNSTPSTPTDTSAAPHRVTSDGSSATSGRNRGIQNNAREEATANGQLPQTSTILPLLGLIGLGSLIAGLFARR